MTERSHRHEGRNPQYEESVQNIGQYPDSSGASIGKPRQVEEGLERLSEWLDDDHEVVISDRERGGLYSTDGRPIPPEDIFEAPESTPDPQWHMVYEPPSNDKRRRLLFDPEYAIGITAGHRGRITVNTSHEDVPAFASIGAFAATAAVTGFCIAAMLFYMGIQEGVATIPSVIVATVATVFAAAITGFWYAIR